MSLSKIVLEGIEDEYKNILEIKELKKIIKSLQTLTPVKEWTPSPQFILNAFRLCKWANLKVVIIGQDPYPTPGDACGLAFGTCAGIKPPKSLAAIFACLKYYGLLKDIPTSGNLDGWAQQGVLLLNTQLTTKLRTANAHTIWQPYTDNIIRNLCKANNQLIFILWGGHAEKKANIIREVDDKINILSWGHPSPISSVNRDKTNPKNFIYCKNFIETNEILAKMKRPTIDWNRTEWIPQLAEEIHHNAQIETKANAMIDFLPEDPKVNEKIGGKSSLWIGTDGSATKNGRANCRAGWAFSIRNASGEYIHEDSGEVPPIDIPGEVFKTSNNRGELTAIIKGLEKLETMKKVDKNVVILSDSEWCIKSITLWVPKKIAKGVKDYKNPDLFDRVFEILEKLKKKGFNIEFQHVRSHTTAPKVGSFEHFKWELNDRVDKLATQAIH